MSVLPQTMLDYISVRDHRLMRRVQRWSAPRWVQVWMVAATRGGDGWLWALMAFALLLFGGESRLPALAAAAMAVSVGVAIFLVLKRATGRKRPCSIEPHCWAQLLPPDQFSFPSGHSITAFAMATSLGSFYPSLLPGLLFCALSVAASRVVLGMHFLSDVVAGCCLGGILGYVASAIYG